MISAALNTVSSVVAPVVTDPQGLGWEFLLLGDLAETLEHLDASQADPWLLAILDKLLAGRGYDDASRLAPAHGWSASAEGSRCERFGLTVKLRRLRDRVAHRVPYALLANEIRCDLRLVLR
jgi:hypothetical protein